MVSELIHRQACEIVHFTLASALLAVGLVDEGAMHDISDVEPGEVYVDLVGLSQNDTHSAVTDAEVNETVSYHYLHLSSSPTLPSR